MTLAFSESLPGISDHGGTALAQEDDEWELTDTIDASSDSVSEVEYSPDGEYILVGSDDSVGYILDSQTKTVVTEITEGMGTDGVRSISWDEEMRYVSLGEGGDAYVYEVGSDDGTGWDHIQTLNGAGPYTWALQFSPDGEYLLHADQDSTVYAYEVGTWNQETSFSSGYTVRSISFNPDSSRVALPISSGGDVVQIKEVGGAWETLETIDAHGSERPYPLDWSADGSFIAYGTGDGNTFVIDAETYTHIETLDLADGYRIEDVDFADGQPHLSSVVRNGENLGTYVHTSNGWSKEKTLTDGGYLQTTTWSPDGGELISGGGSGDAFVYSTGDLFSDPITGTVTDQHGDPVSNATVLSHSITEPALDESDARSLERQAEDLRDELTDPVPDTWETFKDDFETGNGLLDVDEFTSGVDGKYPMVHHDSDWNTGRTTILSSEIDDPRIQVDEGESLVLSVWDLEEDGGLVDTSPVRSSHPGAPVEDTIVVEQVGPSTESLSTSEYDTSVEFVEDRTLQSDREWHAVRTQFPVGVYRIYPEGQSGKAITVVSGDPDQLWQSFESDLRDEADRLTDRAERIRDLLDQEMVVRETTTTDENGSFEIDAPANAVTTDITAMKADGQVLEAVEDPSLQNLREAQAGGYNGSFYLPSPEPNTVQPPAEDVEVTVYKSPEVPLGDLGSFADLMQFLDEQRLDDRVDELQSEYDQRFEEMERGSLEDIYENHRTLIETVPEAEDRYLERSEFEEVQDAENLTQDELSEETSRMQIAAANVANLEIPDTDDPIDIENGEIFAEIPIPDGIDADTIAPEIHWSDGTSQTLDEEYYEVESGGLLAGDKVVISDLPIDEDDPPKFNIRLQGANSDGILDDRVAGQNPLFGGEIPEINAVDWNTMTPGPDERLHVGLNADFDSGYDQLTDVEAFGPDGDLLESSIDGDRDRASFRTVGEGVHHVRLTFESTSGHEFAITERVRAGEQSRSDPATIRASQSPLGAHAVVGSGLESARVDTDGDGVRIEALIGTNDDVPGELHLKPDGVLDGTDHTLDVAVLKGDDERQIQNHVAVYVHLDNYGKDTIASVNGDSITQDGDTRWGEVDFRDDDEKGVLITITDENGVAEIEIDQSPGRLDRFWHWVDHALWTPSVPFSVLATLLQSMTTIAAETTAVAEAAATTMATTTSAATPVTAGPETAAATGVIST
ncbi:WD40 repeat domain-containing protein [Natronorubrum sp. DTA7]|uniref:WD40 repeat domain-containing protein n=1 Tax=Natronorubrum sp. DTA7 TaxID=3447016 RepID=UPI003F836A61